MKDEKTKNILLLVLAIGLVSMTIAYALLSQRLTVTSSAKVLKSNWDVHFKDVTCSAPAAAANTPENNADVTTPLALKSGDATILEGLVASFKSPGDKVVCTFYAENGGTIDAKVSAFTEQAGTLTYTGKASDASKKTADETLVNGKINYKLEYASAKSGGSSTAIETGDVLAAGNSVQMKLTIDLDNSLTSLPSDDVTVSGFTTYIDYAQN